MRCLNLSTCRCQCTARGLSAKLSKCNQTVCVAVDAKQSAQKLCMQRLKLRCGLCACSVVPEPDLTAIAQYGQHQGIKQFADAARARQTDLCTAPEHVVHGFTRSFQVLAKGFGKALLGGFKLQAQVLE